MAIVTARSARGVWQLRQFLGKAHRRGMTRVWTVHNVAHHEGASLVDRWGYRELARGSDLLLCFSHAAETELRREYGDRVSILVISHGSYQGAYPPARSRAEARAHFGLDPDKPVVSCLGLLRRYKGVELACEAVEGCSGRIQLLIAGQPQRSFDVQGLRARAAASGGSIVALPRVLTETEFADAVAASDAVLLPYHAVTGSGVLFAAWTLGAGVIASDLPFFREMLDGSPLLGRTFRTGSATALKSAIEEYLAIDAGERRRAIASTVDQLSPERVVLPFVNALRARDARSRAASATTLPGA
jgi:glycosyltransferase involved in cell wall biosynthesis